MTFAEYQSQVLEHYQKEQAAGRLFFAFPHPTPARIKAGCIQVLETRFERKDESFLRSYFKMGNSQDFGPAVRKFDTDKFRPLNSYLRDPARNPGPEHIQLLAWLIDFPDRPYRSSYELLVEPPAEAKTSDMCTSLINSEVNDGSGNDATEIAQPVVHEEEKKAYQVFEPSVSDGIRDMVDRTNVSHQKKSVWTKKALYALYATLLFSVVSVFWYVNTAKRLPQTGMVVPVIGQKGCVIWTDDHYEPVSCKQAVNGLGSFGLDESTVRNLKRITLPDTITSKSVRKVWYVKIDGHLEYYTAAGFHPVHTERRLKLLTSYMYNKYLFHYADKTDQQAGFLNWFRN
ncbi:hypothetical protein [Mucilaginibacter aquatilis]|uniref:Uncharacterized protein n=1 Tax=Mucilaginibacter aquatilis TaxID=1517760 RepID=A0A6I4I608_9SPHI|nr:hypothetical protein [Mucilaginibacter aquatilis]MVN90511.1 hypothetical protein [Mucilaginibacter aquatilis]